MEARTMVIAAIVALVFLALFLFVDFGHETAPTASEGGESPETSAPYESEPPEREVDQNRSVDDTN